MRVPRQLNPAWTAPEPSRVASRFDRLAPYYLLLERLLGLPRGIRSRAVAALSLGEGSSVLELGCGTGRNLPLLRAAVGASGSVVGVDISDGMLQHARSLVAENGWSNVPLLLGDALELPLSGPFNAALFSLSYATFSNRLGILDRVWQLLAPGGRVVVMDARLPPGRPGALLAPLVRLISRATVLGDPHHRPWDDLLALTADVTVQNERFGTYFVCVAVKPQSA